MTRRSPPVIAACAAWAAVAACAQPTTAIDLELLPSPELNTTAELVSRLSSLVIVVDAAVGRLYPLDAEDTTGDVQIKNADEDPGDLELVAVVPMPVDHLPSIRIERGGLPDVPLHVRVLGSGGDPGVEMARGGVTGVSFTDDDVTAVPTPFNLLPQFLPLMVTEVAPADGEIVPCGAQFDILALFSRAVEPASVTPPGRMTVTELGVGDVPPDDVEAAVSTVTFVPSRSVLDYQVAIASEVTDTSGGALDEMPGVPGLQPYSAEFHLVCDMSQQPGGWCSPAAPDGRCPGAAGRFACMDGTCVPKACSGAACAAGFVCDPTTLGCAPDCRPYGGETCPVERPVCDSDGGYCRA
jgi:hypothetical protein